MNSSFFYPASKEILSFSATRMVFIVRDRPDEALEKEKERIVAELCVDLIEKYGWHLGQIKVGEVVPVISQSGWTYPQVDILACGGDTDPTLLINAFPRSEYGRFSDESAAEMFLMADTFKIARPASPVYLIRYTRWRERAILEDRILREKVSVIEYDRFRGFESWDRAGRPVTDVIPSSDTTHA